MNPNSNSITGDHRWILQIRQTLNQDVEEDTDIPVCIFSVPTSIVSKKPDCYVPQQIALGPYHHLQPELYGMERYKLSAAKRCHMELQHNGLTFDQVIDQLRAFELKIRACYHKYLDCDGETLIWMMALDASFLLEFLDVYDIEKERSFTRVTSRMSHLVDVSCRKFAHNAILRDIVMLENQIPIFLLEKMLEFKFQFHESSKKSLTLMLLGLYKELSPFKVLDECNLRFSEDCTHLLGFLYNMMVDPQIKDQHHDQMTYECDDQEQVQESRHKLKRIFDHIISFFKRLSLSEPLKLIVSNTPMARFLKQVVSNDEIKQVLNVASNDKSPLMEEISIPSVSDLVKAGLGFSPSSGGIFTIDFDEKSSMLFLPIVSVDVNTDVVLRNLVAYEVCNASGPLILTRYTELMNGIIDTKEDAKLLREKGIIVNRLKSDEEVANLWNGMSGSVRLTKVPFLDKVIGDVNMIYGRKWRVKIGKFFNVYVYGSWQILAFVAAVLVLFLMSVEVVSSVTKCILTALI
ncbi:hypothetical protein QVD17_02571 [Tagetes erecta]|uniref:Uncharacterized protein n=1 Tax=Tagetes erecta TaxID=13708 RepID=A0AAD8P7W9_TARER|nr:hypothetical protein QVD17_02571 [Tagetes erecta]